MSLDRQRPLTTAFEEGGDPKRFEPASACTRDRSSVTGLPQDQNAPPPPPLLLLLFLQHAAPCLKTALNTLACYTWSYVCTSDRPVQQATALYETCISTYISIPHPFLSLQSSRLSVWFMSFWDCKRLFGTVELSVV